MNASSIIKITSWLKFLGKNLHLMGCATVCGKSEVMLLRIAPMGEEKSRARHGRSPTRCCIYLKPCVSAHYCQNFLILSIKYEAFSHLKKVKYESMYVLTKKSHLLVENGKGQLILKCLFGIFNTPKNLMKEFDFTTMVPQVELFPFIFWEN